MAAKCEISIANVNVTIELSIDIPGLAYSERKMVWLKADLEKYLVNTVKNTLPKLTWEEML